MIVNISIWMFLHFKHWTRFDKVCWYFVQYFYIQAITEIYVNRFWIVEILHSNIFLHDSWVTIFLSMQTSFQTNYQLLRIKGPAHTYSNGTRIKWIYLEDIKWMRGYNHAWMKITVFLIMIINLRMNTLNVLADSYKFLFNRNCQCKALNL